MSRMQIGAQCIALRVCPGQLLHASCVQLSRRVSTDTGRADDVLRHALRVYCCMLLASSSAVSVSAFVGRADGYARFAHVLLHASRIQLTHRRICLCLGRAGDVLYTLCA